MSVDQDGREALSRLLGERPPSPPPALTTEEIAEQLQIKPDDIKAEMDRWIKVHEAREEFAAAVRDSSSWSQNQAEMDETYRPIRLTSK